MKEEKIVLELIKNNACFYQKANGSFKLELSAIIKDPRLITWLRKFFVEEKR